MKSGDETSLIDTDAYYADSLADFSTQSKERAPALVVDDGLEELYGQLAQKTIRESVNRAFSSKNKSKQLRGSNYNDIAAALFSSAPPDLIAKEVRQKEAKLGQSGQHTRASGELPPPVIHYDDFEEEDDYANVIELPPLAPPVIQYRDLNLPEQPTVGAPLPPPKIKYPDSMDPASFARLSQTKALKKQIQQINAWQQKERQSLKDSKPKKNLAPPTVYYDIVDFAANLGLPETMELVVDDTEFLDEDEEQKIPSPPPIEYDAITKLGLPPPNINYKQLRLINSDPMFAYEDFDPLAKGRERMSMPGFRGSYRGSALLSQSRASTQAPPLVDVSIPEAPVIDYDEIELHDTNSFKRKGDRGISYAFDQLDFVPRPPEIEFEKATPRMLDYMPAKAKVKKFVQLPPPPITYHLNDKGELVDSVHEEDATPPLPPPKINYEMMDAEDLPPPDIEIVLDEPSDMPPPMVDYTDFDAAPSDLRPPRIEHQPLVESEDDLVIDDFEEDKDLDPPKINYIDFDVQSEVSKEAAQAAPAELAPPPSGPKELKPPPIGYQENGVPIFTGLARFSKRPTAAILFKEGEEIATNKFIPKISMMDSPIIDYGPGEEDGKEEFVIYTPEEVARVEEGGPQPPQVDYKSFDNSILAQHKNGVSIADGKRESTIGGAKRPADGSRLTINAPIPPIINYEWYEDMIRRAEEGGDQRAAGKGRASMKAATPIISNEFFDAITKAAGQAETGERKEEEGEPNRPANHFASRITKNLPIPPNISHEWLDNLRQAAEAAEKKEAVEAKQNEEQPPAPNLNRQIRLSINAMLPPTINYEWYDKLTKAAEEAELQPPPPFDEIVEFTQAMQEIMGGEGFPDPPPAPVLPLESYVFSEEMTKEINNQMPTSAHTPLIPPQVDYASFDKSILAREGAPVAKTSATKKFKLSQPESVDFLSSGLQFFESQVTNSSAPTGLIKKDSRKIPLAVPESFYSSSSQVVVDEVLKNQLTTKEIKKLIAFTENPVPPSTTIQVADAADLPPPPTIFYDPEYEEGEVDVSELPPPLEPELSFAPTDMPSPVIDYERELKGELSAPPINYDSTSSPVNFVERTGDLDPPKINYEEFDLLIAPPIVFDYLSQSQELAPPPPIEVVEEELAPPPLVYDSKFRISKINPAMIAKIKDLQKKTKEKEGVSSKPKKQVVIKDMVIDEELLDLVRSNSFRLVSFGKKNSMVKPAPQANEEELAQLIHLNNKSLYKRVSSNLTDEVRYLEKPRRDPTPYAPPAYTAPAPAPTSPAGSFKKDLRPTCMQRIDPEIYELEYKMRMMEKMNEVFTKSKVDQESSLIVLKKTEEKLISRDFILYLSNLSPQALYYVERVQQLIKEKTNRRIKSKIRDQERKTKILNARISRNKSSLIDLPKDADLIQITAANKAR